jgi:nicotinamidase-related amidase
MKIALLIIDLQNDYFPGGKNPLVGSEAAAEQARRLLDYFRQNALQVFHVQHQSTRPGASFFIPGTPGVEFYPLVQPLPGEPVIQKNYPNSFRKTDLLEQLHNLDVQRLAVCGMMTHMCLDAGVRAAVDAGFECWVAADACATKDLSFDNVLIPAAQVHAAFLAALAAAYAKVMPTSELLAEIAAA